MLKFLLVCAAFAALPIQAQTLSGRIVGADARPVPYANIGLKNRPAGTVSGRDGSFTLRIPDLSVRDTLRISCIGYAAREIPDSLFVPPSKEGRNHAGFLCTLPSARASTRSKSLRRNDCTENM